MLSAWHHCSCPGFATDVGVLTELQGKVSPLTHPLLYGALWMRIQLIQQEGETQEKRVKCRYTKPEGPD